MRIKERSILLPIIGGLYISFGLFCNEYILGGIFSSDGNIKNYYVRILIGLAQLIVISFGLLHFIKKAIKYLKQIYIALLVMLIIGPLATEGLLRVGLLYNVPYIKSPNLFADYSSSDEYWKLYYLWNQKYDVSSPKRIHPLLGWSQAPVTAENPLGLKERSLQQIKSRENSIVFYGDSFVEGYPKDTKNQIPIYINNALGVTVVDLGVGGYGLDQTYLMFRETHAVINESLIFVGILLDDDIDRTILSYRTSQKPYFSIDKKGNLVLRGVPIYQNQDVYLEEYPPVIQSYFISMCKKFFIRSDRNREKKMQLTSKILHQFITDIKNEPAQLVFVLFYPYENLFAPSVFEDYVKNQIKSMGYTYIDTKQSLLQYSDNNNIDPISFYKSGNGHHNDKGNIIIAESILAFIKQMGKNAF